MNHEPQTYVDLQDTGNAQSQLVLQAIARHADWDTGVCQLRPVTIARMAKCSERTARRHVVKLRKDGFIKVEECAREDGSTAANKYTLAGYAEWIAANRTGGKVKKPRKAGRYRDDDLGSDDDRRLGQDPEQEPETGGQSDHGEKEAKAAEPPQNGHGQVGQGHGQSDHGAGHDGRGPRTPGGQPYEPFPEPEEKISPPPPRASRRRGRRARECDDLISRLLRLGHERVVGHLIDPVVRRLRIEAPDPEFALSEFARAAEAHGDEVLIAARKRVFEGEKKRGFSVKIADLEEALASAVYEAKILAQGRAMRERSDVIVTGTPEFRAAIVKISVTHPLDAAQLSNQNTINRATIRRTLGVVL